MAKRKKKSPPEEMVKVQNLHTGAEYPMPKSQWEAQKESLKGKFAIVRGIAEPPEVKALAAKLAAKADQVTDNAEAEKTAE